MTEVEYGLVKTDAAIVSAIGSLRDALTWMHVSETDTDTQGRIIKIIGVIDEVRVGLKIDNLIDEQN